MNLKRFSILFILCFFILCYLYSNISYSSTYTNISISNSETLSPGETVQITVSLNSDNIDEDISIIQGQIVYNTNIFQPVSKDNLETLGDWDSLVFNENNGMFIIDKNSFSSNESEEFLRVNLQVSNNIDSVVTTDFVLANTKIIGSAQKEINLEESKTKITVSPSFIDSLANRLLPYTGLNTFVKYIIIISVIIILIALTLLLLKHLSHF